MPPKREPCSESNKDKKDLISREVYGTIWFYNKLFKEVYEIVEESTEKLEKTRNRLNKFNSYIQLSVVWLSAGSSALQALAKSKYNVTFSENLDSNYTESNYEPINEGIIDVNFYAQIIPIVTISISTWSSLILSASRHFRLEENIGNITNLRDRYIVLQCDIKKSMDSLTPWINKEYYSKINPSNQDKISKWKLFINGLDSAYDTIISTVKELDSAYLKYEKLMSSKYSLKQSSLKKTSIENKTIELEKNRKNLYVTDVTDVSNTFSPMRMNPNRSEIVL